MNSWIKMSAVLAVVTALVTALVPESKIKGVYKTLCALVLIFAFFTFASGVHNVDVRLFSDYGEISENLREKENGLIIEKGAKILERTLENKLYESGISAELKAEMQLEDEMLTVKRIYVYGEFLDDVKEKGKEVVHNSVGEECEVIFARKKDAG